MKEINQINSKSEKVNEDLSLDEKVNYLNEIDTLIEELKIEKKEFLDWFNKLEMKGVKFPSSFYVELTYRNEAFQRIKKVTIHIESELQK